MGKSNLSIQKKVAIIAAAATIIAALIGVAGPILADLIKPNPTEVTVTVRVANSDGVPVFGANVQLFFVDGPLSEPTDANGIAKFVVETSSNSDANLFVQTEQYQIYDQVIELSKDQTVQVRLEDKDKNNSKAIIRVVDGSDDMPIQGANVVLLVGGETYSQSTDSNGLAKFTVTFVDSTIEGDLSVSTSNHEIERQRITLQPNQVQDARLNPNTGEIAIATPATSKGSDGSSSPSEPSSSTSSSSSLTKDCGSGPINELPLIGPENNSHTVTLPEEEYHDYRFDLSAKEHVVFKIEPSSWWYLSIYNANTCTKIGEDDGEIAFIPKEAGAFFIRVSSSREQIYTLTYESGN